MITCKLYKYSDERNLRKLKMATNMADAVLTLHTVDVTLHQRTNKTIPAVQNLCQNYNVLM